MSSRQMSDTVDLIRSSYDEEIQGIVDENRALRGLIAEMTQRPPKEQQPKVLQGWITSKAINIDKLQVLLRARRDIDAEASDNIGEDWTQVEVDVKFAETIH